MDEMRKRASRYRETPTETDDLASQMEGLEVRMSLVIGYCLWPRKPFDFFVGRAAGAGRRERGTVYIYIYVFLYSLAFWLVVFQFAGTWYLVGIG